MNLDFDLTPANFTGLAAICAIAASFLLQQSLFSRLVASAGLVLWLLTWPVYGTFYQPGFLDATLLLVASLAGLLIHTKRMPAIALPANDADNLRHAFEGLDDTQISKLLSAAEWKTTTQDELITRQDAPVGHLFFIVKGGAQVSSNGAQIATLGPGSFIGEIAYLTGNMATADVTADAGTRLLTFSRVRLARLAAEDKEIGAILNQLLGRDLAQKMRQTNTRRVLEAENLHH